MTLTFILFAALLVSSALFVVLARNPIHSALALVVNLVGVAGVFASLDAHFLAMVQIIVYAGAIMVLVIFVIMLLNSKREEWSAGNILQLIFAGVMGFSFVSVVGMQILNDWPVVQRVQEYGVAPLEGSVEAVGRLLYSRYILPFEAAGLLLMAALVGAAMLAKTKFGKSKL